MGASRLTKGLLYVAAAAVGLYFSLPIWKVAREYRYSAEQSRMELRRVQNEQALKVAEQAKLTHPAGREEYVRTQGYRRPDERSLELK